MENARSSGYPKRMNRRLMAGLVALAYFGPPSFLHFAPPSRCPCHAPGWGGFFQIRCLVGPRHSTSTGMREIGRVERLADLLASVLEQGILDPILIAIKTWSDLRPIRSARFTPLANTCRVLGYKVKNWLP